MRSILSAEVKDVAEMLSEEAMRCCTRPENSSADSVPDLSTAGNSLTDNTHTHWVDQYQKGKIKFGFY